MSAGLLPTALAAGLLPEELTLLGPDIAKVKPSARQRLKPRGKLVLVTAMTPTPAGEGKTTTAIGLGDALRRLGRRTCVAVREPSLGLAFGGKGAGTGGGLAKLVPAARINLHFTGDFPAVESAHNLLAALADRWLSRQGAPPPTPAEITWTRATLIHDRRLGTSVPRFELVPDSELMSILCLARDHRELRKRLARVRVGRAGERAVTAEEVGAVGPLAVLLADSLEPNLVQTSEGTPAFVHGGPYANTGLGSSSVIATDLALGLSDYAITEAGGATDTGGEKFCNIICRLADYRPAAAVIVASVRALKRQGATVAAAIGGGSAQEETRLLERGFINLKKHVDNLRSFGIPSLVALNRFQGDTMGELGTALGLCRLLGVPAAVSESFAEGGRGGLLLGELLLEATRDEAPPIIPTYAAKLPLAEKIRLVATGICGADSVTFTGEAAAELARLEAEGLGRLPVCLAKPHTSLALGELRVWGVKGAAGAGLVNVYTDGVNLLPGLPAREPLREVDIQSDGTIVGFD